MPTIPSNTSHARIFPTIYRSFIINPLHGFAGVISLVYNVFGHSKRQIVGSVASFTVSQQHPTSSSDESTQARNSGSPMTNSSAVLDTCADSFSRVFQSQNAYFAAGKYFHQNIHSLLLIDVINFPPVWTAVAACRIFPISFLIRLNRTPFVMCKILCSSASIVLCLSQDSLIHCIALSTIQPSTSFLTAHWPSPDSNFFLDIGS